MNHRTKRPGTRLLDNNHVSNPGLFFALTSGDSRFTPSGFGSPSAATKDGKVETNPGRKNDRPDLVQGPSGPPAGDWAGETVAQRAPIPVRRVLVPSSV